MESNLTRRSFLEKGARGLAALAILPGTVGINFKREPSMIFKPHSKPGDILKAWEVDEKTIHDVIVQGLSRGGDYCDLYFQRTLSHDIGLEDREVNRAYSSIDFGVGIRVLKGDQTGYSFTESLLPEAMKRAARTAAAIADSGTGTRPVGLKPKKLPNHYPIDVPWETVSIERKIPLLQTINDRVFSLDPRVVKATVWFSDESSTIVIATSEGVFAADVQPMTQISASCTAEQNGRREQNHFDLSGRRGIEFFTPANVDRLAGEAVRRTVALFEAAKPSPGEMEVVLAAGSSGILLHEAMGHGMEADFNRKGISIFADKIGKGVAEPFVTIVDDGTNPNIRGSINVDDEGNPSQRTVLVENGILQSYLHDRISARHYGVQPTGSGRRQSFRFPPLPRMRNTLMLPGPHTRDDIIKSVSKGLWAESFTNGQVFIGAGDFTFYVKSGALIENGRITRPVKDINIIGNGPRVLRDIVMVADDFEMAEGGWTCGKDGQGVPVSMGLPTVKVRKITVGGISG